MIFIQKELKLLPDLTFTYNVTRNNESKHGQSTSILMNETAAIDLQILLTTLFQKIKTIIVLFFYFLKKSKSFLFMIRKKEMISNIHCLTLLITCRLQ